MSERDKLPPSYAGCIMTLEERVVELCEQHGGVRPTARAIQTDPGYLCKVRDGKKEPSDNLLRKLGLKRIIYYKRFGK